MNAAQAFYKFYSSFGVEAYEAHSVPSGENAPKLPYITYDVSIPEFDSPVALSFSLWQRSISWEWLTLKLEEIGKKIGSAGVYLPVDNGSIWIQKGNPWAQYSADTSDNSIKRIYFNITAEHIPAE